MLDKPKLKKPKSKPFASSEIKYKKVSARLGGSFPEDNEVFFNYQLEDRVQILQSLPCWEVKDNKGWYD